MKPLPGVYRGVVLQAHDPERRGRLQIEIRAVSGDAATWAPVVAEGRRALTAEPGDEVVVAFEAGDPAQPIVIGTLWAKGEAP